MSSSHNRVETTVSAAADAIVTAETRFQQPSTLQKRRWGRSCWNLYSCFGSYKQHSSSCKRVGPAAPASPDPARPGPVFPVTNNHHYNNNINSSDNSSTLARPFLVPPSSPASFLTSHSPSCPHSPAGPASSAHTKSSSNNRNAQIYAIGPYAHEADQLVSPPTFSSTFTTEPSTASYTSPPEPVRTPTEPSSPEVPFARLLSSSFVRKQGYDGNYDDNDNDNYYSLSQYEFQPYHQAMSDSGTSPSFSVDTSPHEPYSWDWGGSSVGSGSNFIHENDNDGEFSYRDCCDQTVEFAWSLGWA